MNDTVFTFGGNAPHSNARQKDKTVTGGKGANLAEMASIGLPVPPGFTIATEECLKYLAGGSDFSEKLRADVADALRHVEETGGKGFGNDGHCAQSRPERRDGRRSCQDVRR